MSKGLLNAGFFLHEKQVIHYGTHSAWHNNRPDC